MICWLRVIVELYACIIMAGGLCLIIYNRLKQKKGIGIRIIQYQSVILIIPTILILGLEKILSSETIATLLGSIIGYILGKDEFIKKNNLYYMESLEKLEICLHNN